MSRILKETAIADIAVHLFIMAGFPNETEAEQNETLTFLQDALPQIDSFGFTYDLFPLACERHTPIFETPTAFGAKGIRPHPTQDLAYRFSLEPQIVTGPGFSSFSKKLNALIERILPQKGLRHLHMNQDSMHLLLIEAQVD